LVEDLIKHLKALSTLAEMTGHSLQREPGRPRDYNDFYLTMRVRDLLIKYGQKVNTYHQGPFCVTLTTLLSACGKNVSESRNQARAVVRLYKEYGDALKTAHQFIAELPQ
jgi:hypothetical protein